jgi:hypothetical protein
MSGTRWVDYLTAHWNPGERPLKDIVPIGIDLHRGKAGEWGRVAVMHWNETADLIKRGLAEQLEAAGFPCIIAPARTPDGRKVMFSYDPTQVAPFDNGFRNVKIASAFDGRRPGHHGAVRMANKYVLCQHFAHAQTGHTPEHQTEHVWPSVNLNRAHVREYMHRSAKVAQDTDGSLVRTGDYNMSPTHPLMRPLGQLEDITESQRAFGPVGTWKGRSGKVGDAIDQAFVRESRHFHLKGQTVLWAPGHERTGGAHGILIVRGSFRAA